MSSRTYRAGDVSAASAVRGIAWITIPAVALATVPGLVSVGATRLEATAVLQAMAFVIATLLLAAALLRRREVDADRQAARWMGSTEALQRMLGPASVPAAKGVRAPMRLFARHPPVRDRVAALRDLLGATDSGLPYALAVGAIAAMAIATCYYIAFSFDQSQAGFLPSRVAAAAGGIMIGVGLVPAFLRRAESARRDETDGRWWQPIAGVAAGLLLGSIAAPGTQFGFAFRLLLGDGSRGLVIAALIVLVGTGMAALAAGLAVLAVSRYPDRRPALVTAGVTAVICCSTAVVLLPVPAFSFGPVERVYLTLNLPEDPWRWLALLYPTAVLILAWPGGARPAGRALVAPVCAAVAAMAIFIPLSHVPAHASPATVSRLAQEQLWIGTLTGLAVLAVLAIARGVPGLGRASLSAWLATLLVELERVMYVATTGGWHEFRLLPQEAIWPSVWLFYLAGPIACLAVLPARAQLATGPRWAVPAAATTGAAAVAISVFASGIPALLVPVASTRPAPAPAASAGSAEPVVGPASGLRAGRELTRAAALAIVADASRSLPSGWAANPVAGPGPAEQVSVRPESCLPFAGQRYLSSLPAAATRAEGAYHVTTTGLLVGTETLTVQVEAFTRAISGSVLQSARAELGQCHRYTLVTPGGTFLYTARSVQVPALARYTWRADVTIAIGSKRASLVTIMLIIGHNLVYITQQTNVLGVSPPPDNAAISSVLNAVVSGLQNPEVSAPAASASPAAPLPDVAGTWTGTYTCRQGVTGLKLVISSPRPGSLTATFSFYPVAANPGAAAGSFAMTGTQSGSAISLRPEHWINQPAGYIMSGLSGTLAARSVPVLSGQLTVPGCSTFSVLK